MIKKTHIGIASAIAGVIVLWGIGYGFWTVTHPAPAPFQGRVDATTLNVASKIPGRVAKINVKEGDVVKAGDTLVEIDIPELSARLSQVKATQSAALAKSRLVDEGPRAEQVAAAKAQWLRAEAAKSLAQKSYARIDSLFKSGLVSAQKHDEARAARDNALNAENAAKSQYEMALTGSRKDEKAAAAALAEQAEKAVSEVKSLTQEAQVRAPRAGEVSRIVLQAGEVTAPGFPLITLVDMSDKWIVFNIREDDLPGVEIGTVMKAKIPALKRDDVRLKVYFINPRADYATWRSTNQSSGYDLRTFEVRARTVENLPALRPGMSVIVGR